jgi:hypothetical protein
VVIFPLVSRFHITDSSVKLNNNADGGQLTVATMKPAIDFVNLPALGMSFHASMKTLFALVVIPKHHKYVAVFVALMPC